MTPQNAFLKTILDNPEDDLPRLVYADWLDERGTPADKARAELIRLQCELARKDFDPGDPVARAVRLHSLLAREEELLKKWSERWSPRPSRLYLVAHELKFARGFPDVLTFNVPRGDVREFVRGCLSAAPIREVKWFELDHAQLQHNIGTYESPVWVPAAGSPIIPAHQIAIQIGPYSAEGSPPPTWGWWWVRESVDGRSINPVESRPDRRSAVRCLLEMLGQYLAPLPRFHTRTERAGSAEGTTWWGIGEVRERQGPGSSCDSPGP